jgi:hypothetical protein
MESFTKRSEEAKPVGTVRAHQEPLDIPTLDTGIHGCYGCPNTVIDTCLDCPRTRLICPDTGIGE